MELRHLRYFVAIAEEGSFTGAAERLWVAQSGLSRQIRTLECELGVQLLERHTRGVELTDAGRLFLERARAALDAAELAGATGSDIERGLLGALRVGLSSFPRWQGSPGLLAAFASAHPGVEVGVVESYGGALTRDLREGRLDAAIVPAMFAPSELRGVALGSEPWTVLMGVSHELSRRDTVPASVLRGREIVVTGHRDAMAYDRAIADTLSNLGLTAALRRGGPGPALLADVAAGSALALGTVACAEGRDIEARALAPSQPLAFHLLWHSQGQSPALAELVRAARRPATMPPPERPTLEAVA